MNLRINMCISHHSHLMWPHGPWEPNEELLAEQTEVLFMRKSQLVYYFKGLKILTEQAEAMFTHVEE